MERLHSRSNLQKGGNVFRAGKIRWAANYVDAKNYALYEIDNKNFFAKVVENGKTFERAKMAHGIDSKDKSFTIRVDVMPDHISYKHSARRPMGGAG